MKNEITVLPPPRIDAYELMLGELRALLAERETLSKQLHEFKLAKKRKISSKP